MGASHQWSDPTTCPFCGTELASPGAGFVDHLDDRPDCDGAFDDWRTRIGDDVRGGWGG
ncbi:DUF7501 family protein [Haloarcula litorea]|uniref:DUF7501 family protein n=1 Tax=Haloarcula litorea TaxID=3032579 RepID=UPI0023E75C6F|nr:hypothetical protein [Halomicroarcula sp. GDY20]